MQGERQVKGFLKEKESCLGLWQGSPAGSRGVSGVLTHSFLLAPALPDPA